MKKTYRMFKRAHGVYYLQNNETKEQFSLKTESKEEAEELLKIKNKGRQNSILNLELGRAYLRNADPGMEERTWAAAIQLCSGRERISKANRHLQKFVKAVTC